MANMVTNTKAKTNLYARIGSILLVSLGTTMIVLHSALNDYAHAILAPGHIYIPNSTYEATNQQKTGIITHSFRIFNLQTRSLQVQAEPDCSCTGISWKKATIQPFSWKDVSASMRSSSTSTSVAISFHTNNPDKPWLFAFLKT